MTFKRDTPGGLPKRLYFRGDIGPLVLALDRKRAKRHPSQTLEVATIILGAIAKARVDPSDVDDAWMPADEGSWD